jgi:FkbM family methyltransferase
MRDRRFERRLAGRRLLRAFARSYPDARFVEVGANAGDHHDLLREHVLRRRWTGVMVEPVPYVFERLRRNYGDLGRVELENVAIAGSDGTLPFYHLAEAGPGDAEGLPHWYDGIGSFSRETVLSHADLIADIERRLVCTEVPCLTFDSLLARHGLDGIDLLLIDTEGYDYEILRDVDLARYRPRVVVFEHFHLSDEDRAAAREQLAAAGYETLEEHFDTFALDVRREDSLTRLWGRLEPRLRAVTVDDQSL